MSLLQTSVLLDLIDYSSDKIALQDETQSIRYKDLCNQISSRSSELGNVEILGLAMNNSVEWVLWDLAALQSNTICIPLPSFFTPTQTDHAIESAGITHIKDNNHLYATGHTASLAIPKNTAKITFTSGTTGTPKGVCLSEVAMVDVANSLASALSDDFAGQHLCSLPLAVLLENVAGVYAALIADCTIHITDINNFGHNYGELHQTAKKVAATSLILVPEILRSLMQQVMVYGPLTALAFIAVGGSKINSDLLRQATKLDLPVFEGYGLSECSSVVALNTPKKYKVGSVGKILPHIFAKIIEGELVITNPKFLGYLGEPTPTDFYTGDLAEIDSDGYLFVTGRVKNVLITSYGRNVSPEWIESLLLLSPDIYQVLVFGDGKPSLSAMIVPFKKEIDITSIITAVNKDLPDYAQIKQTHFVEPFTIENRQLTGTGRPRRDVISSHYNF
jgi:long-subunit acyl-CoA synthetase (AMP-forming)